MTREEATHRIEAAGGVVANSVTKTTDYVIAGTDAGEKLTKAKTLAIPILDETQFLQLLK